MDNDDVIDTLNDLIETSKDGEYGFQSCAEHAKSTTLKQVLSQRASDCQQAIGELQALVRGLGGKPEDSGSASGAVHRGWVAVKGTLAGHTDLALLEECERGEDVALTRYRKALEQDLPLSIKQVVQRQSDGARRNHDQIRLLRDQERAAKA